MSKYLFENTLAERILCIGLLFIVSIITDALAVALWITIFHTPVNTFSTFKLQHVIITFIARFMAALIYLIFFKKITCRLASNFIQCNEIIFLVISNIFMAIPLLVIFYDTKLIHNNTVVLFFIVMGQVTISSITTIYIIILLYRKRMSDFKNQLKLQQLESALQANSDIKELIQKLRRLRHDMRSHFGMIKSLYTSGQFHSLEKYIDDVFEDITIANDIYTLGNTQITIILFHYQRLANEKNIIFSSRVFAEELPLSEKDITSLLTNILSNAIEAAEKVPEDKKSIDLFIEKRENYYFLKCENTLATLPKTKHGRFLTSKEQDTKRHGMGIEIIEGIIKKYSGRILIDFNEHIFSITVHIPCK
ncbi:GHKL domain-containing protein [Anaeromicropila populeti]|nr:GHKL domain-containing protein [Anaeromicropila populeti]